jgi:transposase
MLSLPPAVRIFVHREPTDLRRSFDALAALVHDVLRQDPFLCGGPRYVAGRRRCSVTAPVSWCSCS